MSLPIIDPKAADWAEEALEECGAFVEGATTDSQRVQAVEYLLKYCAQPVSAPFNPYSTSVPAPVLLEAITHVIQSA